MDKKTLGSFIAVLRKSRGMTQRELAEKLGVSDKTVSHWERDESAPDISVIPVIAEIFDVTCDELLKGEKAKDTNEITPKNNQKQMKYLFERVYSKFRTQCLVLTGVGLVGFIFAYIAYWEWDWNFFLVDLIFFIISVFGLVIFKVQNKTAIYTENFDDELTEKYQKKSREIFWYSILINTLLVCISIGDIGFIISPVAGSLLYLILRLTKQITFKEKGQIIEKIIVKTVAVVLVLVFVCFALFFGLPDFITELRTPEPIHFESMEELKSFMETENPLPENAWGERHVTNITYEIDFVDSDYVWKCYGYYGDYDGEILVEFVWRNNEIESISFDFQEDGTYVADVHFFDFNFGETDYRVLEIGSFICFPAVVLIPVLICIFKIRKKLK